MGRDNLITILVNIFSIIGTLVGIVGLVITCKTWKNTKNIMEKVTAEKIKEIYPDKHRDFVKSLEMGSLALKEGGKKYYIVGDIYKACKHIQKFYDNWDKKDKAVIDNFLIQLDEIPIDKDINEKTRIQLQKELYNILPMLERIGDLNGIR